MCSVVVGELCHQKYPDPIILLVTNGTTKVLFEDLTISSSLPIGLRMESRIKVCRSIENLQKSSPKMRDELRSSIRGDVICQAMQSDYMFQEQLCYFFSGYSLPLQDLGSTCSFQDIEKVNLVNEPFPNSGLKDARSLLLLGWVFDACYYFISEHIFGCFLGYPAKQ